MILKMFAVFDSKAESYMAPFYFHSLGQAVRAFSDTASDPKSALARHPGDYTLFCIADYDDVTGIIHNLSHVNLGNAIEHQSKETVNASTIRDEPPLL